jgi:fibronectin-binding autotransporter adhesin
MSDLFARLSLWEEFVMSRIVSSARAAQSPARHQASWKNARWIALAAAGLALAAGSARAVDHTWVNSAGGSWTDPTKWSPSSVPTTDNVFIYHANQEATQIAYNASTYSSTTHDIRMDNNGSAGFFRFGNFLNHTAGSLTARRLIFGGRSNGIGGSAQSGGSTTLTSALELGTSTTGWGLYQLSNGSLSFTGAGGGELGLFVGYGGEGNFDHTGGSVTTASNVPLVLARNSGSTGAYNLSGSATLTALGDETVGLSGIGTFTQSGGTNAIGSTTTNRNLNIASSAGSGTYTLSGGAVTVNGNAYVGGNASAAGGTGVLNLSGGTMTTTGTLKAWNTPGTAVNLSAGTLNVGALNTSGNPAKFNWTGGTLNVTGAGGLIIGPSGPIGSSVTLGATHTLGVSYLFIHSGTLAFSGGTLNAGEVAVGSQGTLQIAGLSLDLDMTLGFGTLRGTGTAMSTGVHNVSGGTFAASNPGDVLTIGDSVNDLTGGSFSDDISVAGSGTVVLAQPSDCVGRWVVRGSVVSGIPADIPTLQIGADNRLGHIDNTVRVLSGGTLLTTASFTTARTIIPDNGSISVASGTTLTLTSGLGAEAFNEAPKKLSKTGAGALVLQAASTRTGSTEIHAGALRIENGNALGTGVTSVVNGGTLEIGGVTLQRPLILNDGSTLRGTGTAASIGTISVSNIPNVVVTLATGDSAADVFTLGENFGDLRGGLGATMHVSGNGTVRLPQGNSYDGQWSLDSGKLRIEHSGSLGSSSFAVTVNSATLELGGVALFKPVALNNGATLRGTETAASSGVATIASGAAVTLATGTSGSDTLTIGASALSGGGGGSTITVAGAGRVILPNTGSYNGNWKIAASTLVVESGLVVDLGEAITGSGTVGSPNSPATPTIINGTAQGNSAGEPLVFTGHVKGAGAFDHVTFTGTFDPGLSPTLISAGSITFGPTNTLIMELGGAAPGSGYDQIQASGTLGLDGTLAVSLINGFNPAAGNAFNLFDWLGVAGTFDSLQLPALSGSLVWDITQLYATGVLRVATPGLLGDYNSNGIVDAADYVIWRKSPSNSTQMPTLRGDRNSANLGAAARGPMAPQVPPFQSRRP